MYTYQDLVAVGEDERARAEFVRDVIKAHQGSDEYNTAVIANDYNRQQNTTILEYRKTLIDVQGRSYEDEYSANYKLPSNFFHRFVTQEIQTLLGNGVTWEGTAGEKLGDDFDTILTRIADSAVVEGCGYGFWNVDHVEAFRRTEYQNIPDEETGGDRAGVRHWQLDEKKPLRATLYEEDGYTDYMWSDNTPESDKWYRLDDGVYAKTKQAYINVVAHTEADGDTIIDAQNYPSYPIVPMWGNEAHQSEIVGCRAAIDAYDLIKSGFANDLDNAQMYWLLHNTGGMDDVDLTQFLDRLKTVHAAVVDDDAGTGVDVHTVEIPTTAREALLDRLRKDLYEDFMALDTQSIASGAVTATQIKAAYEAFDTKLTALEYCVIDFINGILEVAGIEDKPTFTRSRIVNTSEEVQTLSIVAQYLPEDYITEKVLTLMGDGDQAEKILRQMEADEITRIPEDEDDGFSTQGNGEADSGNGAENLR